MLDALPARASLHERLLALLKVGTVGSPVAAGDRVFTLDREGDQEQSVLVVRSATDPDEPPRLLIDPQRLVDDHATAIDWFSPSPDGRLVAYGVSEAGTERGTLRILDIDANTELVDAIPHVRHPSVAWLADGSAFAYSRLPDPATVPEGDDGYWETVWWHEVQGPSGPASGVVGPSDPASGVTGHRDTLVLGDLDRTALPMAALSPDGRWLVLHVHLMPTRTDVILVDRHTSRRAVVVEGEEASTWCQVVGNRLIAVTNLDAPRGRVIVASVHDPGVTAWQTLVPESSAVIEAAVVAGEWLLVASTEHAVSRLDRYRLDGSQKMTVALPETGSIVGLDADPGQPRAFLTFTSFTRPPSLLRWTPGAGLEAWSRYESPIDSASFVTETVTFPSTDGTAVPMFMVRATSTTPSPGTPTVLSGYGGFAISSSPGFSPGLVSFCQGGGVYAVAGIRGGGEYGEEWHRAGMGAHKQQVFDDLAAAADWLVATGRTSRERLAIRGGSNGGLLVGAVITQRPDLCRAAVCAVPLLDMLRYHRFLIGALWVPEYGDPDRPADFAFLEAYSPYHHIVEGTPYPSVLVMTAESDSRVDPMHARKFVARLQAATGKHPVLLRIETRAGHGQGKPASKQADELADSWAFLAWQLGSEGS